MSEAAASIAAPLSVTILLSNYNQGQYLRGALDGIVGQTRPADEIILVDDGSTDDSRAIMAEYVRRHPRIRFMQNETNIGLQATIERVLPLIQTTHMVWTASDDRLLPEFLAESMPPLERHPEAGLCFSETVELRGTAPENEQAVRFAATPGVSHIFDLADLPEMLGPAALVARMRRAYLPIAGNTAVVDVAKLRAIGGFVSVLEWHSDLVAYTILALRHGACVVAKPLAYIRANPQSYSYTGMRSPEKLRRVQEAMLALFRRREFRDIRRALRRAPVYFSVWDRGIMRVMARELDWDLLLPYAVWWVREYKRGHRLSWPEVSRRFLAAVKYRLTTPRAIRARLGAAEAEREALRQAVGRLTAERDGAINALAERNAERDAARLAIGELTAQRDGAVNHFQEVAARMQQETEEANAARAAAESRAATAEKQLETANHAIEAQNSHAADLAGAMRRLLAERDEYFRELEKARLARAEAGDAAALRAQLERVQGEAESLRRQLAGQAVEIEHLRELMERIRLPPMLVTTMPKTGTYFISALFESGLKIESRIVSHQYFPEDVIRQPELRKLSEGNCISQDHFGASRINLTHIARHVDRVLVHLRDPRQAMLSYVHYLNDPSFRANEKATLKFIYPPLPDDFYALPLSQRLDWGIDHWLPLLVDWVQGWLKAEAEGAAAGTPLRIGFTRFEEMATDREAFIARVLDFFDIPAARFFAPPLKAEEIKHFRRGETDEWRRALTPAQIARANRQIPPAMAERFGWPLA